MPGRASRPAQQCGGRSGLAGHEGGNVGRRTLALLEMAVDALRAIEAASRGTARRRSRVERPRSCLLHTDRQRPGRGKSPAGVQGGLQGREDRGALDATGVASFIRVTDVQFGSPVEEIARIAGHSSTRTTEVVYRRELRPILTTCAEAMDRLFNPACPNLCLPSPCSYKAMCPRYEGNPDAAFVHGGDDGSWGDV